MEFTNNIISKKILIVNIFSETIAQHNDGIKEQSYRVLEISEEFKNSFHWRTSWKVSSLGLHPDLSPAEVHSYLHLTSTSWQVVWFGDFKSEESNFLHIVVPSFVHDVLDIIMIS